MATTTVRIDEATRDKLRIIANSENEPIHVILERAIEDYRRKRFLEDANRAYNALRQNQKAWAEELEERAVWDATLSDNLEDRLRILLNI